MNLLAMLPLKAQLLASVPLLTAPFSTQVTEAHHHGIKAAGLVVKGRGLVFGQPMPTVAPHVTLFNPATQRAEIFREDQILCGGGVIEAAAREGVGAWMRRAAQ